MYASLASRRLRCAACGLFRCPRRIARITSSVRWGVCRCLYPVENARYGVWVGVPARRRSISMRRPRKGWMPISPARSDHTVHVARELGIHFYAAGHHATDRYGVAALGDHLAQRFGVKHLHLDLANPVCFDVVVMYKNAAKGRVKDAID